MVERREQKRTNSLVLKSKKPPSLSNRTSLALDHSEPTAELGPDPNSFLLAPAENSCTV